MFNPLKLQFFHYRVKTLTLQNKISKERDNWAPGDISLSHSSKDCLSRLIMNCEKMNHRVLRVSRSRLTGWAVVCASVSVPGEHTRQLQHFCCNSTWSISFRVSYFEHSALRYPKWFQFFWIQIPPLEILFTNTINLLMVLIAYIAIVFNSTKYKIFIPIFLLFIMDFCLQCVQFKWFNFFVVFYWYINVPRVLPDVL